MTFTCRVGIAVPGLRWLSAAFALPRFSRRCERLIAAITCVALAGPTQAATLLHAYSFDAGITDAVGTANGAALNGAFVSNSALVLDGIDDYVQFSTHLVPTSGSYSVSLFARQASAQSIHVEFISQGESGTSGFYIGHNPVRVIRASDSWVNTGAAMPPPGDWHHYALVVNADAAQSVLYLDGSVAATLPFAIASTPTGDHTRFGAQFQGIGEFFHGELDEISIFSGALTSPEVQALAAVTPGVVPVPAAGWMLLSGSALLALRTRLRLPVS